MERSDLNRVDFKDTATSLRFSQWLFQTFASSSDLNAILKRWDYPAPSTDN